MVSVSTMFMMLASMVLQFSTIFGQQDDLDCVDDSLCFKKPDNYPETLIDEFLIKHNPLPYKPDYKSEELEKFNHEKFDELNCSTKVKGYVSGDKEGRLLPNYVTKIAFRKIKMVRPFAINKKGRVYPVIQSKYFTQRIRQVSCEDQGRPCFEELGLNRILYNPTCQTQQSTIQLYVFDDQQNEVVLMQASYNCCCKCSISRLNTI